MTQLIFVYGVATRPETEGTNRLSRTGTGYLGKSCSRETGRHTSPALGRPECQRSTEAVFATAGQVKSFSLGDGPAGIRTSRAGGGAQANSTVAAIAQKNPTAALDAIFRARSSSRRMPRTVS